MMHFLSKRTAFFASLFSVCLIIGLYVVWSLTSRAAVDGAALHVVSGSGVQNGTIDVVLEGFAPNESVTLWQTFPDARVLPHVTVRTDS